MIQFNLKESSDRFVTKSRGSVEILLINSFDINHFDFLIAHVRISQIALLDKANDEFQICCSGACRSNILFINKAVAKLVVSIYLLVLSLG